MANPKDTIRRVLGEQSKAVAVIRGTTQQGNEAMRAFEHVFLSLVTAYEHEVGHSLTEMDKRGLGSILDGELQKILKV
jgi:hypothetical protein|tara:strand:- start:351 stop:584 length:234 start_codon:yes stop_codon:yes gene_type:complete